MKIGSVEHKELFCRSFMESHIKYEPEQLPWPDLDDADLDRLRKIPFWEEALNTERESKAKVDAYTKTIADPLVREAVILQGMEEDRHARLFQYMIERYGIEISGQPLAVVPDNIEQAFIDFGYGECVDAFLGFALFKIARQSAFLPEAMFNIFDILLQEETRHIVFFVNWVAYLQVSKGRGTKVFRAAHSLWYYSRAFQRLINTINSSAEGNSSDFSATEASVFLDNFSFKSFLSDCLQENKRRMSYFDERLILPEFLPDITKIALFIFNLLPKRSSTTDQKNSLNEANIS